MRMILSRETDRVVANQAIRDAPLNGTVEVIVREYKENRSLAQNKLLHAVFAEVAKKYADHHGRYYSPDVWKEYFKGRYLGSKPIILPNGQVKDVEQSTAGLNRKQFSDFLERIFQEMAESGILITTRELE